MFIRQHAILASVCVVLGLFLTGCTSDTASPAPSPAPEAHAHPSHGPHHGELIELGNEAYHAEVLHDDTSVTIYVLNGGADQQVAIEATEITINAVHGGQPKQFTLAASPDANDPEGKSSRFVSEDTDLVAHIDDDANEHRLALTIDGKSYRGAIAHDHGHDHADDHGHEGHGH